MESKRKTRKVHKAKKALPQPQITEELEGEKLIKRNGELVEEMLETEAWREIVLPVLNESIASVSGRYTNGRWHHGDLTRTDNERNFLAGYQKGLMDLNNRLLDFVDAKNSLLKRRKEEALAERSPMINPFLEEE